MRRATEVDGRAAATTAGEAESRAASASLARSTMLQRMGNHPPKGEGGSSASQAAAGTAHTRAGVRESAPTSHSQPLWYGIERLKSVLEYVLEVVQGEQQLIPQHSTAHTGICHTRGRVTRCTAALAGASEPLRRRRRRGSGGGGGGSEGGSGERGDGDGGEGGGGERVGGGGDSSGAAPAPR